MAYMLATNRLMGLSAFRFDSDDAYCVDSGALACIFKRQLTTMCADLKRIYEEIGKDLSQRTGHNAIFVDEPGALAEQDISIFRKPMVSLESDGASAASPADADAQPQNGPIVGRFRSQRVQLRIQDVEWDLRLRPTVTACSLERKNGFAKLWWTFEGVPGGTSLGRLLSEEQATEFVTITTGCANEAIPLLRSAYVRAIPKATERGGEELDTPNEQLRVTLADNNARPFLKLIDAMYLEDAPFGELLQGAYGEETQKGATELVRFIEDTGSPKPEADKVVITESKLPGLAAAYSDLTCEGTGDGPKTKIVTGLASSSRMLSSDLSASAEWRRISYTPEHLRSLSAARPLSAELAHVFAQRVEAAALAS